MLNFDYPIPDDYIKPSSKFGWRWIKFGWLPNLLKTFHNGVDFPCPTGTKGHAAYKGIIDGIWAGFLEGLALRIYHPSCSTPTAKVFTYYFHLKKSSFQSQKLLTAKK